MTDRASTTPIDIEVELPVNTDLSYVLPAVNVRDVREVAVITTNQGSGGVKRSA